MRLLVSRASAFLPPSCSSAPSTLYLLLRNTPHSHHHHHNRHNHHQYSTSSSSAQITLQRATESDQQGISIITFNRPEARNAISRQFLDEFSNIIRQLRHDKDTRVAILRSAVPSVFCAGADLRERKTMSPTQVALFLDDLNQTFSDLERLPMPTIASIQGAALGGGLELALCCDFRVADSSVTKIGLPETGLAIIPGAGGTQRLPRLIGLSKAKQLIYTARPVSAEEAFNLGVVDKLANSDKGEAATDVAIDFAKLILSNGPLGVRAAKAAIDRGNEVDIQTGLDIERQAYKTVIGSKDRLEGLQAFAEKRKPQYKGE